MKFKSMIMILYEKTVTNLVAEFVYFNYTVRNDLRPEQLDNVIIEIKKLIRFQFLYTLGADQQVHRFICSKSLSQLLKKLMQ